MQRVPVNYLLHKISREIVNRAKEENAVIVLGDLKGIRNQNKGRKFNIPRPKIALIDLDGTILEYNGWQGHSIFGRPTRGVKTAIRVLKKNNIVPIVWTCRPNSDDVKEYLRKNNIKVDFVNCNPYQPPDINPNKLFADFYIDRTAVPFDGNWRDTVSSLLTKIDRKFDIVVYDFKAEGMGSLRARCRRCGHSFGEYFYGMEAGLYCEKCGNRAIIKIKTQVIELCEWR